MRRVLPTIAGCLLGVGAVAQQRPNIIVFLVDDMGVMDTSVPFLTDSVGNPCRHKLNDWYRTPNMELLAQQGTRFSTFYAQSVSSPSRTSLLTGQNATRHHTTNWIHPESNNRTEYGPHDWNWMGLNACSVTYPRLLKQVGYRTIHVGKAHFGCVSSEGENPLNVGFDVNIGGSAIGEPGSYFGEDGYGEIHGEESRVVPHLDDYRGTPTFLTEALTQCALEEISKSVREGKTFYLNMAHYAVHNPFQSDPRFSSNYLGKGMSEQAQAYATLVEGVDYSLGVLLQHLKKLGIAENTLIFFLGDNGGDAPLGGAEECASSAPLRGKKGSEYEGGTRVPFIVSWVQLDAENYFQQQFPIASGYACSDFGTVMDIFPTILDVVRVDKPEHHVVDGNSLLRLCSKKKDSKHRNEFLLHFPHEHRGSYFTAYRRGDWKLIYYYNPENPEEPHCKIFNLLEDPYEENNCVQGNVRIRKKMFNKMCRLLKKQNAQYPVDKEGNALLPKWRKD